MGEEWRLQHQTTLVIVTHNSAHLLEERLRSYAGRPVIVVDNASSDETSSILASKFPDVRLIANGMNSGYGRAANQGFERVETPYALLVNPDARIEPGGIDRLENEARELEGEWLFIAPDVGIAPQGRRPFSSSSSSPSSLEQVEGASGAALFFDVARLRRLGGFDPNIFLFYEETDLCLRAMRAGLTMYFAAGVEVEHELGSSSHRSPSIEYLRKWHYNWSKLYFYRKHRRFLPLLTAAWKNLVVAGVKLVLAKFGRKRNAEKAALLRARHRSARAFVSMRSAFEASGGPNRDSLAANLEQEPARIGGP